MLLQPSMQPAPAIHKATVKASTTRTTFIDERNFIPFEVYLLAFALSRQKLVVIIQSAANTF
ncbi:MAG: hypothetical protein ABJB61_00645 [bacterium]